MKKLLSICFLSMLLVLAGFTAKSQVTTNCCFWLENMQPDTVQDISNLGITPGDSALLPGHGNPLVLYNTMSRVDAVNHISVTNGSTNQIIGDRTDWYRVRFDNTCNLPGNTKVSLEWKLYNNGQLIQDADLSDYVDVFIYTKFTQLANTDDINATPAHNRWLGGPVYGNGVCHQVANNCVGGYPGSMVVDATYPYADYGFSAQGHVNLAHAYHLDFFYLDFFANAETRIGLRWKQVGNYSLVVGLRERTNGSEFNIWSSDAQDGVIGGHQSCCGALLAQDSIHYLVNTNSQKVICERDQYLYGSPQAMYSQTGMYNVLFGTYTCGHWQVDSIDLLDFQTRITPDIVAHDTIICRNEPLTVANIESLAPAVHTDAPGLVSYQRYWRKGNTGNFTTTPALPNVAVVGTTTYYVYQVNNYDTIPGVDISCTGYTDTFTVTVLPIIPPVLDNTNAQYQYCNSEITPTSTQVIKAKLNNTAINNCAQEIHWFTGTTATGTPVAVTNSYTVNLHDIYNDNFNKTVTYTAFSYAPSTHTYSDNGVTVTFKFWANPELARQAEDTVRVVCPHKTGNVLHSNFVVTNTNATTGVGSNVTWTYVWKKNGTTMTNTTANITVTAPGCDVTDTYVVTATATSSHGCTATITRTFTVKGEDHARLDIAWRNSSTATRTIYGCDTTAASWTAPYTMADVSASGSTSAIRVVSDPCSNVQQIHYFATVNTSAAPCTTVVTRNYYVTDECGNFSDTIKQTVTIINNTKPVVTGPIDTLLPVRVLNNDCKDNMPPRSVILAAFKASHTITTACGATVPDNNIRFYVENTNIVADGNLDIFANTDVVTITVIVTDQCGNVSDRVAVARLYKPAAINIAHGATLTPDYEVCNYDTVTVTFDTLMIYNGFGPYQYAWSQDPKPEESGIIYTSDPTVINVYALVGGAYYTSSQFIMTITDIYGCVASDTSNAIHFFPVPTVNIVEDTRNDDYPHAAPYEVCPTFGHYLLEAQAIDNLPYSYDHTLTYVWTGEAIDYTSTNSFSFIAVNENICDRYYTATATVTNTMGCITNAQYTIHALDTIAPVLSVNMPTDTVAINAPNCKISVPDYTHLYTASTVSDNCWNMDSTVVTQNPAAGTLIGVNTNVIITVAPKCGPAAYDTIKVCFPEPRISTTISATVDSSCYPYSTTLSVTTLDGVAPYTVVWNNTTTANTLDVNPTETANRHNVVVVTDAMGCQATDDIDLVVYHKPVAADVLVTTTPNNYCDDAHANGSITITVVNGEIDSIRLNGETEWHALPYTTADTVAHGTYAYDLHTIHGCETAAIAVANVLRDTVLPASYLDSVLTVAPYTHNDYCTAPWHGTVDVVYPVDGYTYHVAMHVNTLDDGSLDTCGNETHVYDHTLESDLWFNYLYQDTYYVEVTTNYNCHYTAGPVVINDARVTPPVPSMTITPNTTCGSFNGVVRLNNTDPKYEYTLNGITWRGNNSHRTFDLLPGGSYNLHIYNPITRCENDATIIVPDSSAAPVFANNEVVANHRTNCTVANGSIAITAVPGFTYTVTDTLGNVVDPADYNKLTEASYTVRKLDNITNCYRDTTVVIEMRKPVFPFTLAITPDLDCNDTIGTGTITVTSAAATYTLVNATGDTMPSFTNLNTGNYTVYVYNAATQCTYQKDTTVATDFTYPSIVYTSTANFHCDSMKNGAIIGLDTATNVNYSSFTYFVNGVEVGSTITGLDNGTYSVYAMTNYHCATTPQNVTVLDSAFFPMDFTIVPNSTCVWTLTKPGNGQIHINKPQGTQYQYVFTYLDSVHYGYDVDHFEPIDYTKYTLMDGHYAVTITDTTTGCVQHDTLYVPFDPTHVTIDSIVTTPDYSCRADVKLGTITVTAHSTAASAILSYSIDNGATYQLSNVFTEIAAGPYTIIIRDTVNNCVYDTLHGNMTNVPHVPYDLTYEIDTTPNQFCFTTLYNGSITINNIVNANPNPTGYLYSIDGGATYDTSNVFTGLDAGTYVVSVKDTFTGCTYDSTAIIRLDNDKAPDVAINGPARICKNADGVLTAIVTPKLAADTEFTYVWYNDCPAGVILSTADTCKILTDMVHCCTYTVEVTSVLTGCKAIQTLYVCVDSLPVVHFMVNGSPWTTRDPNNFFNCENEEILIGVDPTGLVSHVWTNGVNTTDAQFTVPANSIPANTTKSFCVTITDNNGCSTTDAINVISKPIFKDTVEIDACGTYTYHYNISGLDSVMNFAAAGPNVHTLVDTFAALNGCDSIMTYIITISAVPSLTVTATIPASICDGETILASGDGYTQLYGVQHGWRIVDASVVVDTNNCITAGTAFNINSPVSEGMNGQKIYAYCANNCDTTFSTPVTLTVTNVPTLAAAPTMKNDTICAGSVPTVPTLTAADVNWHGTTTNECKIEYKNVDSTSWNVWTPGTPLTLKGVYAFRFVAKNECSDPAFLTLDTMGVIVNGEITINTTNKNQVICLGQSIADITITTTNAKPLTTSSVVITPASGLTFNPSTMKITGAPTSADTFYVAITAENEFTGSPCPTATAYDTIIVKDTVTLSVAPATQEICLGNAISDIVITSTNATISVVGTLPTGLAFSAADGKITGTPEAAGTHTITINAASSYSCGDKTATVEIVVHDTVSLTATNLNQEFCLGDTMKDINITIAHGTISTSTLPAGLTLTGNKIKGTPVAADTIRFKIYGTNTPNCRNKELDVEIIVNDTVKMTVAPKTDTICLGNPMTDIIVTSQNAVLTYTAPTALGASASTKNDTIHGLPTAAGTYQVAIQGNSPATYTIACPAKKDTVIIVVNDTVTLSATPLTQTLCLGDPMTNIDITVANATLSLTGNSTGVALSGTTISGTPVAAPDTMRMTITATSDKSPACDAKTVNVVVIVNDTVKFSVVDAATLTQTLCRLDTIDTIKFNVANADLSIVGSLPAGLTFDAANNSIYGIPTAMDTVGTSFFVKATSNTVAPCGKDSLEVKITVNDKPVINAPITDGTLDVCEGALFTKPTDPSVTFNGLTATTFWWMATDTADWTVPAVASIDGAPLYYIAYNKCGADTLDTVVTVYPLPVPSIASDTIICLDGQTTLTETSSYTYISYQWKDGEGNDITGATSKSYTFDASSLGLTADSLFTFTLTVTDSNNCTSVTADNVTTDDYMFASDTVVTVKASDKPRFVFTNASGTQTHTVNSQTTDPKTDYTWMVSNPCGDPEGKRVFVTFDIFRNDTLLTDGNVGTFIQPIGSGAGQYIITDNYNMLMADAVHTQALNSQFNYAQSNPTTTASNHFPKGVGTTAVPNSTKYDYFFLHYLTENPINRTVNQFLQPGEYEIHYNLVVMNNSYNDYTYPYYNLDSAAALTLGGFDFFRCTSFDTLATDIFNINVTGSSTVSSGGFSLITTGTTGIDDVESNNASMFVYPNPTNSIVNARINGVTGVTSINVVNIAGQIVAKDNVTLDGSEYIYSREVRNLTPGVYFIQVKGENTTLSKKLVISK